eukprot:6981813-Pyramimonas_sp.AAC.1
MSALSQPGCDGGFQATELDDAYLVKMLAAAFAANERIKLPSRPDGRATAPAAHEARGVFSALDFTDGDFPDYDEPL